jgi:glycine/D-amino acid oxidase-like deaminating enzyme
MTDEQGDLEQRMARVRHLAGPASFRPGFSGRVMARLAAPRPMAEGLQAVLLRLAPLAAAAAIILGAANLISSRASGQPLIDRLLGLPEVTLAAAYSLGEGAGWTEVSQ